jgi:hypothetical protein
MEPPVRYCAIELSDAGIAELSRESRRLAFVPKDEIIDIELRRGPAGERIVVQTVLGVAFLGVAFYFCRGLVLWLVHGGPVLFRALGGAMLFAFVGGSLLWTALRPRHHLRIATRSMGLRKLAFGASADPGSLRTVIDQSKRTHGYVIRAELAAPPRLPYRS